MRAKTYCNNLIRSLKERKDITINKYKIYYKNKSFDFLRISSRNISKKDKIIFISSGIHGDETAGPMSILKYANEMIDYAHSNNIKIIIYPLMNPSGFEFGLRYNIDNNSGEEGNNDFLRYELENGRLLGDIKKGIKFKKWHWSSDVCISLPKETILIQKLLKKEMLENFTASIDLHQDKITRTFKVAAYHYSFGKLKIYRKIIMNINSLIDIYKNKKIDAGFSLNKSAMLSDNLGFIVRHDASISDLFFRLGVKHCVTVETTGVTPLNTACNVNLIWIRGIIDLISSN